MGNFIGTNKTADTAATAAAMNADRLDVLINAGDYEDSGGSSNAYTLTLDSSIVAYVEGMVVKFQANFNNTGPATVNVNSLGAKSIKRLNGLDIVAGDILSGQIAMMIYDGTNFQLVGTGGAHTIFGGDGSDGALNVTSGTTSIDCGGSQILIKNYSSINISAGATVNFTNLHSQGTIIFLKSQGNITITGTLDVRGCGSSPGQSAYLPYSTTNHSPTDATAGTAGITGGANGSDGSTATGGTQLDYIERIMLTNEVAKLSRRSLGFQGITGQGSATNGTNGNNSVGGTAGTAGTAGSSGRNGTLVFIECGGGWDFTGTIDVRGANGSNGTNGNPGQDVAGNNPGPGGGGGGGGGAGGIGGYCTVLYNSLIANSGTINSAGGTGGAGGDGGRGGNGAGSGSIGQAGAGGGSGSSGSSSGTFSAAGAIGRPGVGGRGSQAAVNTYGGTGGSGGSGGAGGGTFFGGAGSNGVQGSIGSQSTSSAGSTGGAGGSKGTGGAGAASIGGLVTKNYYF